jgi:hypothetical protein
VIEIRVVVMEDLPLERINCWTARITRAYQRYYLQDRNYKYAIYFQQWAELHASSSLRERDRNNALLTTGNFLRTFFEQFLRGCNASVRVTF